MPSYYMHMLNAKPICAWKRNTNIYSQSVRGRGIQIYTPISYMASSPPSFRAILTPSHKYHRSYLRVIRAQSFRDEGRSSNMVDASLRILRERMEEVRNKERPERCCSRSEQGWNYASGYNNYKYKRETLMLSHCFDVIGLIAGNVGLTIVSATFLLCLVSLILHLNQ